MCLALILSAALLFPPTAGTVEGPGPRGQSPPKLRVALLDFVRGHSSPAAGALESALSEALSRDNRLLLIDRSIIQAALAGIGYSGSINMSRDEARRLGGAIGCDFFIVGKTEALTRSDRPRESHEDAYAGVLIVDGRTGTLEEFDFILKKAEARGSAIEAVTRDLSERASSYVNRMLAQRDGTRQPPSPVEPLEDIPDPGSPRAAGFTPPEFTNRVRPEYPMPAEQADISATVEALAVFRRDGEIGAVEIIRWAGFGLDASAERAIRQLRFKPAARDGRPVNVRALVRYNFRRLSEPGDRIEQPAPEPPSEKPVRDLRELFKPTYRRPTP